MIKEIFFNTPYIEHIPENIIGTDIFELTTVRKGSKRKSGSIVKYNSIIWKASYCEEDETTNCIHEFIKKMTNINLINYVDKLNPKSKFIVVRLPVISSDIIQEGGIKSEDMKVLYENSIDIEFWYY